MNPPRPLRVVAAIIENTDGTLLIAERPPGKHAAGLWEFPGGKVEAGESDAAALRRELQEELGIDIGCDRAVHFADIQSSGLTLHFYHIALTRDIAPQSLEGQRWRWVTRAALRDYAFPAPNHPVVERLAGQT